MDPLIRLKIDIFDTLHSFELKRIWMILNQSVKHADNASICYNTVNTLTTVDF